MKMSQLKMVIREVVREEIRMGLKEILGGVKKQPVQKPKPKQKQYYSKNPILNEVLNNTEAGQDWETMGGTTYTSERMSELVDKPLPGNSENANGSLASEMGVDLNDPAASFLKKDYRAIMDAVEKKKR